jgi:hypothetical protein
MEEYSGILISYFLVNKNFYGKFPKYKRVEKNYGHLVHDELPEGPRHQL